MLVQRILILKINEEVIYYAFRERTNGKNHSAAAG